LQHGETQVWQSIAPASTVSGQIAQQILNPIEAEELTRRTASPGRDLAALLGLSGPSVREARRRLRCKARERTRCFATNSRVGEVEMNLPEQAS
jgi:hypothetical protein